MQDKNILNKEMFCCSSKSLLKFKHQLTWDFFEQKVCACMHHIMSFRPTTDHIYNGGPCLFVSVTGKATPSLSVAIFLFFLPSLEAPPHFHPEAPWWSRAWSAAASLSSKFHPPSFQALLPTALSILVSEEDLSHCLHIPPWLPWLLNSMHLLGWCGCNHRGIEWGAVGLRGSSSVSPPY